MEWFESTRYQVEYNYKVLIDKLFKAPAAFVELQNYYNNIISSIKLV